MNLALEKGEGESSTAKKSKKPQKGSASLSKASKAYVVVAFGNESFIMSLPMHSFHPQVGSNNLVNYFC